MEIKVDRIRREIFKKKVEVIAFKLVDDCLSPDSAIIRFNRICEITGKFFRPKDSVSKITYIEDGEEKTGLALSEQILRRKIE